MAVLNGHPAAEEAPLTLTVGTKAGPLTPALSFVLLFVEYSYFPDLERAVRNAWSRVE